jgi:hypothetical protein
VEEQRAWHRLFGMSWTDFFVGLPVVVEMEKDLSMKQQFLDVAIIRTNDEPIPYRLPDGFEDLGKHNLITFKSHHDTLDGWALNELVGYYVNYRKQISPSMNDLLPESDFRLFAVSVRFPQGMSQSVPLRRIQEGVYEASHFTGAIRLIVVHQLPLEEQNAMLHLFADTEEMVRYGETHYRPRSWETSRFLLKLFDRHRKEGMPMPYTKEQFIREANEELAKDPDMIEMVMEAASVEKRLEGIPPEKRLEGISPEKRLEGISPEKRLEGLSPEEILQGMSPQLLAEFRRQFQGDK